MEQDQEFYKKLMALMSQNKELTLKNGKGKKTIKITFDVCQQTQNDTINFQNQSHLGQSSSLIKNIIMPELPFKTQVQQVQQNDFKMLSLQSQRDSICKNFDSPILPSINIMKPISDYMKDSSIQIYKEQTKDENNLQNISVSAIKPKKVLLGSKNKNVNKPANEAVLNFIQSRNSDQNSTQVIAPAKESVTQASTHHVSFDFFKSQQTPSKKLSNTSKTVNQSIELLKQLHPQNLQQLELISQRMMELQKVQKDKQKFDEQISQILSASFNNSLRFDSFDVSMLSAFRLGVNSDPLCQIFVQYLKRNQSQKNNNKNTSASFLFLYSQPMLDIHGNQIDQQINYFQQQSSIQKVLKQIKCKIQYIRQRATMDKFNYWLKQSVQILHFSGHGVQQKQNYLLFQSNTGKSVKMDTDSIEKLLHQIKPKLKLVFVASCHSESTGRVFREAGVNHVICVKDDHVILDQICQQFVKTFYKSCIHDKMGICQAFKFAKRQLQLMGRFSKHEIQKFLILHTHQKKECNSLLSISEGGQFKDLTFKPYYNKTLPSRVQNFIPRPKDLHQILKLIDSKKRFITITGMSGIGKSTLARQLIRYIQFRNIFLDGVVYVQIRGCQNMSKIIETLDIQLFQNTTLKHNRSLQQNTQKIVKQLTKRHVLIVMDNCQHIMASDDKQNFKKMIESIMKNCDDTYFVFTHRTSLSRQIDYCSEKIYELDKLNQRQSYNLFFQTIPRNVDKLQLGQFFKIQKGIKEISKHPIFQFLNGHPEAICMTASLLSDRSLPQLYQLLLKPVQDLSNQFGIQEKKLNNDLTSNKVVQTAMKISLNVLKNKSKYACEMIRILSMLPRGLDKGKMSKIMAKPYQQHLDKLVHYSLVKQYQKGIFNYYCVHPNIIIYVQSQIGTEQKIKYHQKICQQFVKRCQQIYKCVGTLNQNSQRYQQIFLNEEDNFKAIILRQLSIYGESIQLKRLYTELFQGQYYQNTFSSSYEEEQNFHSKKPLIQLSDLQSYFNQINKKAKFNEKGKQSNKKQNIMLLVVYYVTNLFVIKKANFCQKYIQYGLFLAVKKNNLMAAANLVRLKGCIQFTKNKIIQARQYFQLAWQMFALEGCGLGAASCESAVGYIKFVQEQYAMAKMNMESALKYYGQIDHPYGKHYLNRWLCQLKSKMNRAETQLINHKKQAQKLIKQAKISLKSSNINNTLVSKHKLGYFVFRFLFDNMSLFLEATFQSDVKPKLINQIIKKNINQKIDKPILVIQKPKQQRIQLFKQKEEKTTLKQEKYLYPKEDKQSLQASGNFMKTERNQQMKNKQEVKTKEQKKIKEQTKEQVLEDICVGIGNNISQGIAKSQSMQISVIPINNSIFHNKRGPASKLKKHQGCKQNYKIIQKQNAQKGPIQ